MIRLEDDFEPDDRADDPPHIMREIAVLVVPAIVMIAGFVVAICVL